MAEVIKILERSEKICLEEFEKFYDCLMRDAPKDYNPWFFPCKKNGKDPAPQAIISLNPDSKGSWHHKSARVNKEQCLELIRQGYNVGISAREGDPLIIIDIDEDEYLEQLPKDTLTVTSRKRAGAHAFGWDKDGSAKINLPTDNGEIRSKNQYVLSCGSFVAFNFDSGKDKKAFDKLPEYAKDDDRLGYYTVKDERQPREMGLSDLPEIFKKKAKENIESEAIIKNQEDIKKEKTKKGKYSELFNLKVSDILEIVPEKSRSGHPLHESDTDANFSLSNDGTLGHCWRHMVSLNAVQYLCVKIGYGKCEDCGTPHKGAGLSKIKGDKAAIKQAYDEAVKMELIPEYEVSSSFGIFGIQGQVEQFYNLTPFHYNRAGLFLVWDDELKKYDIKDDVDMLNGISSLGVDTISSKNKSEIINAIKQYGRKREPKTAPLSWVQFKDKIYDFKTNEEFDATPEYFVTNPIPWKPGESEETPTIDALFLEWVGQKYKPTLDEITAYSACSEQFMQRMIALVGGGSNGKGTYLKLISKFIGKDNICSSELKELSSNQFETAVIYKKLLCIMGEVSQDDLKNTNQIKKISGEDDIRYCFKGKTPFTEPSPTTLINATNSLPRSPDKTMGFYRKWLIIDFPNQFTEIKHGIIESIPDEEFENLARKVLRILNELYKSQKFTNEGNFQERMERYEERANPVGRFLEVHCEEELGYQYILKDFCRDFNEFAKKNHVSIQSVRQIGRILREEGVEIGKRQVKIDEFNKTSQVVLLNFKLKTTRTTKTTEDSSHFLRVKSTSNYGSSGSSGSFSEEEIKQTGLTLKEFEGISE